MEYALTWLRGPKMRVLLVASCGGADEPGEHRTLIRHSSLTCSRWSDAAKGKPSPDVFLHAARKMGVEPLERIVVKDRPAGISRAPALGMKVDRFGSAAATPVPTSAPISPAPAAAWPSGHRRALKSTVVALRGGSSETLKRSGLRQAGGRRFGGARSGRFPRRLAEALRIEPGYRCTY